MNTYVYVVTSTELGWDCVVSVFLSEQDAKKLKEEDEKIRKEYGIKDDEDWFDGRYGIKVFKRSDFNRG